MKLNNVIMICPRFLDARYDNEVVTNHQTAIAREEDVIKKLDLEFTLPEVIAVAAAILIVEQISGDGESNWVEGVQLLSVYAVLAILFYFLPDVHTAGTSTAVPAH